MKRLKNIIALVAVFAGLSGVSAWCEQPGSWQAQKEQAMRQGERAKAQAKAKKETEAKKDAYGRIYLGVVTENYNPYPLRATDSRVDSIFDIYMPAIEEQIKRDSYLGNFNSPNYISYAWYDENCPCILILNIDYSLYRKTDYRTMGYYERGNHRFLIAPSLQDFFVVSDSVRQDVPVRFMRYRQSPDGMVPIYDPYAYKLYKK